MGIKPESITIPHDKIVAFDCDDTLVMWEDKFSEPGPERIEIIDPNDNGRLFLRPHKLHIRKLKMYYKTGWFVIIWSAGGADWARTVRDSLGLKEYAHLTMSKPSVVFDDLPVGEGIGRRLYFQPKKQQE